MLRHQPSRREQRSMWRDRIERREDTCLGLSSRQVGYALRHRPLLNSAHRYGPR